VKAFIIFRDRVSYAKQCWAALHEAGLDVHVIDHASTYPPAMDWLTLDIDLGVGRVHRLVNQHPQRLWTWSGLDAIVGRDEPYVVTDCDVVPVAPLNWVSEFKDLLRYNQDRCKIGMSLRTSDIPEHYQHRQKVINWEAQHWQHPLNKPLRGEVTLFGAAVDTTLAMYQPLNLYPSFSLGPALRTGYPYYAKHLSWYEDSSNPSEEQIWYEAHMNRDFSHWIAPERYS
jgi:hypothetical protein